MNKKSTKTKGPVANQPKSPKLYINEDQINRASQLALWFDRARLEEWSMRELSRRIKEHIVNSLSGTIKLPTHRAHLAELKKRYEQSGYQACSLIDDRRKNRPITRKIPEDIMTFVKGGLATKKNNLRLVHRQLLEIAVDESDYDRNTSDLFLKSEVPSYHKLRRAILALPDCERPQNSRSIQEHYENLRCLADKSRIPSNERWHLDECQFKLYDCALGKLVDIYITAVVDYHSFVIRSVSATRSPLDGRELMRALKLAFKSNKAIDMPRNALPHIIVMDSPERHHGAGILHLENNLKTATGREVRVIHYRELPEANASAEVMMKKLKNDFSQSFKTYFAGRNLFDTKKNHLIDIVGIERLLQQFAKWHNNQSLGIDAPNVRRLTEYERSSKAVSWKVKPKDIEQYVLAFTPPQKLIDKGIKLDGRMYGTTDVTKYGQTIRAAFAPEGGFDSAQGFVMAGKDNFEFFGELNPMDNERAKRALNRARLKVAEMNVKTSCKERDAYMFMFSDGISQREYRKENRGLQSKSSRPPRSKRKVSTKTSKRKSPTTNRFAKKSPKRPPRQQVTDYTFNTKEVKK